MIRLLVRLRQWWTGCEFCWTRHQHRALIREDRK